MAERIVRKNIMFKKKLGFLLGVMVALSLAGYLVCLLSGNGKKSNSEENFLLVTSFYPMYVLAENLTEGVEGITVSNLTENQTGCLHDYQLTSRDMKLLSQADAFLINGAGMELFMEKVLENNAGLPVIEASHGIPLLEGAEHNHAGTGHEEHGHDEHEHSHDHAENGHVWLDVERYRSQLSIVKDELIKLLPEQKTALETAAAAYDAKLQTLTAYTEELKKNLEGTPVVIFHEAFAYLAESVGMDVIMALSLDEETVPSAGEIAEVIAEIKYHGGAYLLIEREYADYADKILAETNASAVYLEPLTTGDGDSSSYYKEMQKNLDVLSSLKGIE